MVEFSLVFIATPAFADDQYKIGGSYAKMTGGKSLKYHSYTPVYSSFTTCSLAKPLYHGTVSSGSSYQDLVLYANSNPVVLPIGDTSFSLPDPTYNWDSMFTSPVSSGGCGYG